MKWKILINQAKMYLGFMSVKKTNNPNPSPARKIWFGLYCFGAGGRTRTDTVLLPMDFESITSANSITPAYIFLTLTPLIAKDNTCEEKLKITYIKLLVEIRGFEPLTSWMPFKRSPNWAISPTFNIIHTLSLFCNKKIKQLKFSYRVKI